MKKLIILGGTGFLGYYTAKLALSKGYEVASVSLNDVKLEGWYPPEIKTHFLDVFTCKEEELVQVMQGYDYMVYAIGPDDRITPKALSYEFFHERLVDAAGRAFRAAEKAGVKKAVVYNSYFAYFDRKHPELHLAIDHPYVKCRLEQAELLNKQKSKMQVVVLELPYIFGSMPERMPLWKDVFLERFAYGQKIIFFPKGSTTMTAVEHIAEAGIGALEYGKDGERYPIGDENHTFNWMLDEMMVDAMGKKRKIVNPPAWLCAMGANSIMKKDKKNGLEPGLNLGMVMKNIMSKDLVIEPEVMDAVNKELHISRGGLKEAIKATIDRCYPNHSFK
jgi:dihydroflavonol-4-reductase